jgi:hypothetical protein
MMMSSIAVCAAVLAAIATISPAFAQGRGRQGRDPKQRLERQMSQLKDRLSLSPDQEKEVRSILEDSFNKTMAVREKYQSTEPGQRPPREAMEELRKIRAGTRAELGNVLNEKQMEEYQKLRGERRGRFRQGGQRRQGGRRQP